MKLSNRKVIGCGMVAASFLLMTGFKPITPNVLTNDGTTRGLSVTNVIDVTNLRECIEKGVVLNEGATKVTLSKEQKKVDKVGNGETSVSSDTASAGVGQFVDVVAEIPADAIPVSEEEKAVEDTWANKFMANVSDQSVNIRAAADINSEVIGVLYKGSQGDVLEKGDVWTKISSGNAQGYVSNDYLVFGADAAAIAARDSQKTAKANTDGVRARKSASTDGEVAGYVEMDTNYQVSELLDGWVKLSYDGTDAYVASDLVNVEESFITAKTIAEIEAEVTAEKAAKAAEAEAEAKAKAAKEAADAKTAEKENNKTAKKAVQSKTTATQNEAADASYSDVAMLAALIECEAGGESYEGQVAVGAVVMNRVRSRAYPSSISGVIKQSGQFSPVASGKFAKVLARGAKSSCVSAAQAAIGGSSPIGSALYFRSARSGTQGTIIGGHVFY